MEFEEGDTVKDILEREGIPSEEVLAAVDDTVVSKQRELDDGDRLRVFDVIAGG
ncbi:MAG: MoaD/ThiS family protein [Candidatus Nanohaloarchaea archaeon]